MKQLRTMVLLLLAASQVYAQQTTQALSLDEAIAIATASDPWVTGSQFREQALSYEAVAVASLPDPQLTLAAGNFPVDSFDINQEAMTQLSVGLSQMFPRGDSLELGQRQKQQLSAREPLLREDRKARVAATVTELWLDAYRSQESVNLIERDRALFEYLVDAARSSYSAGLKKANQQDLIRAQLELTRLEDRLSELRLQQDFAQRQLFEWVGHTSKRPVEASLPDQPLAITMQRLIPQLSSDQGAYAILEQHPTLRAFEKRIEAMSTGVDLTRQKYKPAWGLQAQYGYRDEDLNGIDRADLFSLGVTVDLPFFTSNRQDKELAAALARTEALRTDRQLLARQLVAQLQSSVARLRRLDERETLYREHLLPQMANQADAALNAYNNDDGDFAEAVRARIDELDAKIDALSLLVERQQSVARINYLLTGTAIKTTPKGSAQ